MAKASASVGSFAPSRFQVVAARTLPKLSRQMAPKPQIPSCERVENQVMKRMRKEGINTSKKQV
ncbi:hypothetical protein MtrunA17_Chr2g0310751 [Medicago truncatula]|uniref:Uncharacterized protein n=1 Tax=Medicago truncatula TaxID=3880 RepID=A0A396JHA5_MEDTR|nr:hypothetical protein MtrunA17_Chr2g0310751 [Medicago truncatula]